MTTPVGFTKITSDFTAYPVPPQANSSASNSANLETSVLLRGSSNNSFALHDLALTSLDNALEQYYREEQVNQSLTQQGPQGSAGAGIYNTKQVNNPELQSPFHAVNLAYQTLQGTTKILVERLTSWAADLLHDIHSHKGSTNSEVNVVEQLSGSTSSLFTGLNLSLLSGLARYKNYLEESGKHQASTLEGHLADYAHGNNVVRTNNVRQYEVAQFRVRAGAQVSIEAPTCTFATQQLITQSRFNHVSSDLQQQSHLHYWLRAEDNLTQIGTNTFSIAVNSSINTAPNRTLISGGSVAYADAEFRQYGQYSQIPIHATRAKTPSNASYGQCVNVAMNDYSINSVLGGVNITSGNRILISAPLVLINPLGMGQLGKAIPQTFSSLVDPAPYQKASPVAPTGKVSVNQQTPEPPITTGGPVLDLGA